MILGIGNDIIDIRRVEKSIERFGERLGSVDGDELDTVPLTNLSIDWQPWDRRLNFALDAINLLDHDFDLAEDIPAPGRTIILSGHIRF